MRILYLCHRIPYPPNKGEKIRAFRELKALAERHDVDLFTLADRDADLEHQADLEPCCRRVVAAKINPSLGRLKTAPFLFTRKPLTLPYFYSAELDGAIRRAVLQRSYDRIFVFCSAMAQYVEHIRDVPAILDLVDVDSDKWLQYAALARLPWSAIYRREAARLREYERKICADCAHVVVTTDREARLLAEIAPTARIHVIPNGVDAEYFKPAHVETDPEAPSIVFTGDMSYFPNEQAVRFFAVEALPLVRRAVPNARFRIVGHRPSAAVRKLQEIDGVEVTGYVPDIRPYLAEARVAVAPFTVAAGIQNKILEAMASGLPVVATRRAAQGLAGEVADVVEIADTAAGLAAGVVRVLRDRQFGLRRAAEGRRRVLEFYNWGRSLSRLLELVENPLTTDIYHAELPPAR